jgi:RimJ/RimL family protein N-acetyltransferase
MKTILVSACTLEPQIEAHAAEMFYVLSDLAIYEYEGEPPPSVEALARGYRRKESRFSPDGRQRWLNWIVRLPNGEPTGYVQATVLESGASLIGYEFSSRYWRRGIGSAAIKAMIQELVASYSVHTVVAVLKIANFRSMGLLQHLGFEPGAQEHAQVYEAAQDETVMLKAVAQAS